MLYIAADHGGLELKKDITDYLQNKLKLKVEDLGASTLNPVDDYPDFAIKLAHKVVEDKSNLGILICRNGQGMCVTANKIAGARAIVGFDIEATKWARNDDHVNILCLPAEYISKRIAKKMVKIFIETPVNNDERFLRRLKKIAAIEI